MAETYKIHGSCDKPSSLVLTETDYGQYESRNAYLAAKLLTIFAEHPVIFLGYSLTDEYIRDIILSIVDAVGPDRLDALQKQIYFVEWNEDPSSTPSLTPYYIDVFGGKTLPAQKIETNSFAPIFEALSLLDRPFPAHILRELKKHVYDLVTHPDPNQAIETVRAIPLDSEDAKGLRVVFGIGKFTERDLEDISSISGRTLTREDLAQDVLGVRKREIVDRNALQYAIPFILQYSANAYLPVFKYLRGSGLIDASGKVDATEVSAEVRALMERTASPSTQTLRRYDKNVNGILGTPREVLDSTLPLYFKLECLLCLDPKKFDLEELREVLVEFSSQIDGKGPNRTGYFKAISYYDRLKYA